MSSSNQVGSTTSLSENQLLEAAAEANWADPNHTDEDRLSSIELEDPLQRYFENSPNSLVLEIGCSEGYTTAELSSILNDSRVEGRDISEGNVDKSKDIDIEGNWNVDYGSARNPNISGNPGLVVAAHSLGQLIDKGVISKASENRDTARSTKLYTEEVLESLSATTMDDGYLFLADDHNYLIAQNTQEGWKPVEGRDFRYTQPLRDMGYEREVEKDHTNFYQAWLDSMTDSEYKTKMIDLTR